MSEPRLAWPRTSDEPLRAAVHRLLGAVVEAGGAIGYLEPPGRDVTDGWLESVLAHARAGDAGLVTATVDGALAGCGVWQRREAVPTYRHTGELRQIMTHPAHAGRGVGRAVVTALAEGARAAGLELLTLGVRGNNDRAIGLYSRLGFREWGRLPGGIAVGDERFDDVRMCCVLDPAGGVRAMAEPSRRS